LLLAAEKAARVAKAVLAWRVVLAVRLLELQIFYLMDSLERLTEITGKRVLLILAAAQVGLPLLEQAVAVAVALVEQA